MKLFDNLKTLFSGGKVDLKERYEILREAILGTMSKCYKARDRKTGRIVALKVMDAKKTADFEARFKGLRKPTEGEIAASLSHPRIVTTYEYGIATTGEPFLVMEYLEGEVLHNLIRSQSPQFDGRRVEFIRQVAEAVHAVHSAGYIHRDICPRNFIVSQDFEALKLIDFGLTVPATRPFMLPGNRTGTPNYMAPELVRRQPTDQRLDIFALGVTAYEICTFQLPWERGNTGLAAVSHSNKPPTPIREYRPQIHPELADAIELCFRQNPDDRCPTVPHFLKLIRDVEHEDAP